VRAALPVSQAVDEYLSWIELDRQLSKATVEGYRGDLRRFIDFAGTERPLLDVDRDLLRAWQRRLAQCDARLTAETLGHRGLGSVAGYTKITDARRRQAYEQMEKAGL